MRNRYLMLGAIPVLDSRKPISHRFIFSVSTRRGVKHVKLHSILEVYLGSSLNFFF